MEAANIAAGLTNLDRPLAMSAIHGPMLQGDVRCVKGEKQKPRELIPGGFIISNDCLQWVQTASLAANDADDSQSRAESPVLAAAFGSGTAGARGAAPVSDIVLLMIPVSPGASDKSQTKVNASLPVAGPTLLLLDDPC